MSDSNIVGEINARADVSAIPVVDADFPCDACGADTGSPDVYYCNSSCHQTAIYRKAAELREAMAEDA